MDAPTLVFNNLNVARRRARTAFAVEFLDRACAQEFVARNHGSSRAPLADIILGMCNSARRASPTGRLEQIPVDFTHSLHA